MKSIIRAIANSYDPSVGGALGLVTAMIVGGAIVAAPVAAGVGALIAGGSGALWGGGAVLGAAFAWSALAIGPHYLAYRCYKHVTRRKIEKGEPLERDLYFPGVKELKKKAQALHEQSLKEDFERQNKSSKDQKKQPDPNKKPKNPKPR